MAVQNVFQQKFARFHFPTCFSCKYSINAYIQLYEGLGAKIDFEQKIQKCHFNGLVMQICLEGPLEHPLSSFQLNFQP